MTLRRRSSEAVSGLELALLDFLLGVHRSAGEIGELQANGIAYDRFGQFDWDQWPAKQIDELWRQNGQQLRDEAKRRGIALPAGRPVMAGVMTHESADVTLRKLLDDLAHALQGVRSDLVAIGIAKAVRGIVQGQWAVCERSPDGELRIRMAPSAR